MRGGRRGLRWGLGELFEFFERGGRDLVFFLLGLGELKGGFLLGVRLVKEFLEEGFWDLSPREFVKVLAS